MLFLTKLILEFFDKFTQDKVFKFIKTVIDNKTGLLVDFFDYDGIADSISKVLEDPKKYRKLGKAARKVIIDKFDLHKITLPKYLKLIENILNEK